MKTKILNAYAGLGGNRKLWEGAEVTAIEYDPKIAAVYQRLYPNDSVIVGDAHAYILDHAQEFDLVWSSPPCQSHSKMMKATRHKRRVYPDMSLYEEILYLREFYKGDYVVENVVPYYGELIPATRVGRHLFWTSFDIDVEDVKRPPTLSTRTIWLARQNFKIGLAFIMMRCCTMRGITVRRKF